MKVISCSLQNFASYKSLEFNFNDQGLCLIEGSTGSGKSTLCDAIPWILFGKTAKNGSVDEIISWPGTEVTIGTVYFEDGLEITRSRGSKAKDNDLSFCRENDTGTVSPKRGKDLQDTQKLINNLLGIDSDLYLAGAYFHEFSQTAQFFNTTAKNRRMLCEQIGDLSLAQKLQIGISENKKLNFKELGEIDNCINIHKSNINLLNKMQTAESTKFDAWETEHKKTVEYIVKRYHTFEAGRKKVISNKCGACGTILSEPKELIDHSQNPYKERVDELNEEVNPHSSSVKDFSKEIHSKNKILESTKHIYDNLLLKINDLEMLESIIQDFRGIIVRNAITQLENNTNDLLTRHFDAEIKVEFSAQDADKLEVSIQKDGNICAYTQLSKGQRQLLKLCFGVSVMKAVANQHGVKFHQIWFDESTDGCDENVKLKALKLFEELALEYESVFLVEHNETVKAMVNNKYTVELVSGNSVICQN